MSHIKYLNLKIMTIQDMIAILRKLNFNPIVIVIVLCSFKPTDSITFSQTKYDIISRVLKV